MLKNFGSQPWLYPMPVLMVSAYAEDGTPCSMAIGWCGILDPSHLSLCLMEGHRTTEAILSSGAFTAGVADVSHLEACDYLGSVSGKDVPDKVARSGLHPVRSQYVNAPILEDLPLTLECRLESFDPETGRLIGQIVNVCAEESVLDDDGHIDADRFQALAYDPCSNSYRKLGTWAGVATQVCDLDMDRR